MTCNVGDTICNCTLLQKCGEGAYGEVWLAREVANGANYILAIFAKLDEHGNEIAWEGETVPLLDAVLRHQKDFLFLKKSSGNEIQIFSPKGRYCVLGKRW